MGWRCSYLQNAAFYLRDPVSGSLLPDLPYVPTLIMMAHAYRRAWTFTQYNKHSPSTVKIRVQLLSAAEC